MSTGFIPGAHLIELKIQYRMNPSLKEKSVYLLLVFYAITLVDCDSPDAVQEKEYKILPDRTPLIMGLVEATYDTVHHFPEIVVGYVRDVQRFEHPDILDSLDGVYNPALMTQVAKTSRSFELGFTPAATADVAVRGPIGTSEENFVAFSHTKNGVYGDINYRLTLIPEGSYQLTVQMPDGRSYQAQTIIPEATDVPITDSISVKVHYEPYGDGTPREEHIKPYSFVFRYPEQVFLTEVQTNSNLDREILLLEPWEHFQFKDRGPYWRTGASYGIGMLQTKIDTMTKSWVQRLDKPIEEIWMKRRLWYRFSFYSEGIGNTFHPMVNIYSSGGKAWDELRNGFIDAYESQDSTYLFDVSTIRKLGSDGKVLPKKDSDAIGFFGGYFSVYRKTTLYPIRTFDLDSVLARHNKP